MSETDNEEVAGFEVRWLLAVVMDLRRLFPPLTEEPDSWKRSRHPRFVVERHARKLAWWREDTPLVRGDLPWRWVPELRMDRVAEVRIADDFGAVSEVRHLFQVCPGSATGVIWGLGVWRLTSDQILPWIVDVAGLRLLSIAERDG